eukprot:1177171-Rhodomonas_salina.1
MTSGATSCTRSSPCSTSTSARASRSKRSQPWCSTCSKTTLLFRRTPITTTSLCRSSAALGGSGVAHFTRPWHGACDNHRGLALAILAPNGY